MTRYLLATASVHTTAAAADYLGPRLDADDAVLVVTVAGSDVSERDAGDAANVARSRLLPATVEVLAGEGDPAEVVERLLADRDVDELVVGARRGDPDARAPDEPGSTVRGLLGSVAVPVVVLPPP